MNKKLALLCIPAIFLLSGCGLQDLIPSLPEDRVQNETTTREEAVPSKEIWDVTTTNEPKENTTTENVPVTTTYQDVTEDTGEYAQIYFMVKGEYFEVRTVEIGTYLQIPKTPSYNGYEFAGWYFKDEPWEFFEYTVEGDMTLEAEFIEGYKVTVQRQASTEYLDIRTDVFYYNSGVVITLPKFENTDDAVFECYLETYSGKYYDMGTDVYVDGIMDFELQFHYKTLTLVNDGVVVNQINVSRGNFITLDTPYKAGYTFNGWADPYGNVYYDYLEYYYDGDMTLTAQYEKTVVYMCYDEYVAASYGTEVSICGYIQGRTIWANGQASFYLRDINGVYYIYNLTCTENEYNNLLKVGSNLGVTGLKSIWKGHIEINYGSVTENQGWQIVDDGYKVYAKKTVKAISTENLDSYQNYKISTINLTVVDEPIYGANGSGSYGDDIYLTVTDGENIQTFVVESSMEDSSPYTNVYLTVNSLETGNIITVQGFVYYYNVPQVHITSCTIVS